MYIAGNQESFSAIEKWLAELPDQVDGIPSGISDCGEPYVEFIETALSRPDDVKTIEGMVARHMSRRLQEYLEPRKGRIYWRIRFESDIDTDAVVVRYDENGPDVDVLTDRPCVLDKNWRRIGCYCRLYRARHVADYTKRPAVAA